MKPLKKQKIFHGLKSILYIIVFLSILILLNIYSIRHYTRFDVTSTKIYSLSEKTINILKSLKKDISIIVLYSKDTALHESLYPKIKNLLEQYKEHTDKVSITFIDPEQDIAQTQILAKKYNIETAHRIIIECGDKIKHLTDTDISVLDFSAAQMGGEPQLKAFRGEQGITSAILSVTEDKKLTIAFTEGHGEKSIDITTDKGLSKIKTALERDNYNVISLKLLGKKSLTKEDADILVVVSPLLKFTEDEISLLENYVKAGGNLFVSLDPIYQKNAEEFESGMEGLLENFGFVMDNTIIVDPAKMLPQVSPANLYVDAFQSHIITENLKNAAVIFFLARSVQLNQTGTTPGYHLSPLAYTSEHGWGETDITNEKFAFNEGEDIKGPVTVFAIAENPETRSKIFVIGDSDFMSNYQVGNVGNGLLALNALNWLAEKRDLIAIPPRDIVNVHTSLTGKQMNLIFFTMVVGFPILIFLSGIFVWWKRNRK